MVAYVGQTSSRRLIAALRVRQIGECVVRGEIPPKRTPWFYDCGAYRDWAAARPFDAVRYLRDLWRIRQWPIPPPAFVVLPDVVAGGVASLAVSLDWVAQSAEAGAPVYLAVQDGMTVADVTAALTQAPVIAGIFVGGTLPWKRQTTAQWIALAHDRGRAVHVGRVGTYPRVQWARALGVDSIDSSLPLWSTAQLDRFVDALHAPVPGRLPLVAWTAAARRRACR